MSDPLQLYELYLSRLLCPWDSLGKNTGVGCHTLFQRIFPTQGLNPCLTSLALAAGFFTTTTAWEACGFNYQIWVAQLLKVLEATDSYSKQSLCLTSDTFVSAGPWIILHSGGRSFLWGKMSPKRRQIRTTFRGGWIDLHLSLPVCWCLKFFLTWMKYFSSHNYS